MKIDLWDRRAHHDALKNNDRAYLEAYEAQIEFEGALGTTYNKLRQIVDKRFRLAPIEEVGGVFLLAQMVEHSGDSSQSVDVVVIGAKGKDGFLPVIEFALPHSDDETAQALNTAIVNRVEEAMRQIVLHPYG